MRSIIVEDTSGESLQDVVAGIKQRLQAKKQKTVFTKLTLEQAFGKTKAKNMRLEAAKRAALDHQMLGDDY